VAYDPAFERAQAAFHDVRAALSGRPVLSTVGDLAALLALLPADLPLWLDDQVRTDRDRHPASGEKDTRVVVAEVIALESPPSAALSRSDGRDLHDLVPALQLGTRVLLSLTTARSPRTWAWPLGSSPTPPRTWTTRPPRNRGRNAALTTRPLTSYFLAHPTQLGSRCSKRTAGYNARRLDIGENGVITIGSLFRGLRNGCGALQEWIKGRYRLAREKEDRATAEAVLRQLGAGGGVWIDRESDRLRMIVRPVAGQPGSMQAQVDQAGHLLQLDKGNGTSER